MKIFELEEVPEYLKITDFENFFNIYNVKENAQFNLNSTLYLNIQDNLLEKYILTHNMHWPLISYKIYGTTRLVWLLLKINNIQTKDIFKIRMAAETIKYLPIQYVQQDIIQQLNGY